MAKNNDVEIDDSLPFDLTKSLEENIEMLKARMINDGYSQKEADDFFEKLKKKHGIV